MHAISYQKPKFKMLVNLTFYGMQSYVRGNGTFCVEFRITLLREMLKSSTLSITLFLLMCMCLWDRGLECMESLSKSDLGDNVCERGTHPSRSDLCDNVCEGGTPL